MSTAILPLETSETIIDFLADDDDNHSALKTCSLVCQAFLPRCRKHIFASIILNDSYASSPSPTTYALGKLLSKRPGIADYIRKLDYSISVDSFFPPISELESLKRISRLESLTIQDMNMPTFNWSNNSIRPILLHLLHLPTLTHFRVFAPVTNFAVSDLIPCVNLKHLDIGDHTTAATETPFPAALPEHPILLNEFVAGVRSATAIMNLCAARRPDGQYLIDFRFLSKITVVIEKPNSQALQGLFTRCETLTDVDISFRDCRVRPSLVDMLRPSMQSLRHIVVHVSVEDVNDDPLVGIPSDLEDMRTKNIIESVTIGVLVLTDQDCSRGDDWGRLEEVLTSSGWFALKRVSLAITIASYFRSDNELEVALRKLPETQFPRLSTSESISFDFEVRAFLV